jgi:hypothetical protein
VRRVALVSTALVVMLYAGLAMAHDFHPGSEPDGFKGILWGRDLSTIGGMKFVASPEIGGSFPEDAWDFEQGALKKDIRVDVYERSADDPRLYGVIVETIRYGFWKGKFCEATVVVRGHDNWRTLKEHVFEQFGKGARAALPMGTLGDEQPDWYYWRGGIAEMELIHLPASQSSKLWMGSTLVRDQAFGEARE